MAGGASDIVKYDTLGAAVLVRGGPVILTAIRAINTTGADAYVQIFDVAAAASITLGTTVPDWVVLSDFGAGLVSVGDGLPTEGLVLHNGLVAASTTTPLGNTAATQHVRFAIR